MICRFYDISIAESDFGSEFQLHELFVVERIEQLTQFELVADVIGIHGLPPHLQESVDDGDG